MECIFLIHDFKEQRFYVIYMEIPAVSGRRMVSCLGYFFFGKQLI